MDRKLVAWAGGVLVFLALGAGLYLLRLPEHHRPREVPIVEIPLAGEIADPEMELSGLAWWHDRLVLMPQYPERHGSALFTIERDEIERFLEDPLGHGPLEAHPVPFDPRGVEGEIVGFDGFEALAFSGDTVWFAVEGLREETEYAGFLVAGHVEGDLERIVLQPHRYAPIESQNELENTGYETLVIQGDRIVLIYETNGEINEHPHAAAFDRQLDRLPDIPLAHLEYRVTDATEVDRNGHFWVTNYHWPGAPWSPGVCSLTERYGEGQSHARCRTVERLVELHFTDHGLVPSPRPPIQLELIDDEHARNWEGLVRFGGQGFLVVTDEHPSTMLAFVPLAPK